MMKRNPTARLMALSLLVLIASAVMAEEQKKAEAALEPQKQVEAEPKTPPNPYRLILPKEIPAVVGVEANIYFDNILLKREENALVVDVNCARGQQQRERWTFVPTAKDVGKHRLTINVCDETMKIISSTSTTVRVLPADAGEGKEATGPITGNRLPNEILAVVGVEANIYFDNINIVPPRKANELVFDVNCARGQQQPERWTFVPTAKDVGKHRLTVNVCDETRKIVSSASTTIRVLPADAGEGKEVAGLIVGDSLTAASAYPRRIVKLFAQPKNAELTLVGTTDRGNGNRHEGYGGWTCNRFVTLFTKNPKQYKPGERRRRQISPFVFWNEEKQEPVFDFPRYAKEQAPAKGLDFVTIALGCNDTFSSTERTIEKRIDTMFVYLDRLIAGIHKARPDTRIGIVSLVPPAGTQDAFGTNYKCGQTRWQYRRNQHRVLERTFERYDGRENDHIYIVPAYVNLDTINGYPSRNVASHAHSPVKIRRLSNGVHPSTKGYYQMGDSIYCWIKSQL